MTKGGKRRPSGPKRRGRSPTSSKASSDANIRLRERMRAIEARYTTLQSQIEHWIGLVMQEHPNLISDEEE